MAGTRKPARVDTLLVMSMPGPGQNPAFAHNDPVSSPNAGQYPTFASAPAAAGGGYGADPQQPTLQQPTQPQASQQQPGPGFAPPGPQTQQPWYGYPPAPAPGSLAPAWGPPSMFGSADVPNVPARPDRVPFPVILCAVLMGALSLAMMTSLYAIISLMNLASAFSLRDDVGELFFQGLVMVLFVMVGALIAASAWSMVRNGGIIGPYVTGGLGTLLGIVGIIAGATDSPQIVPVSTMITLIGLLICALPLFGPANLYLRERRAWSRAEGVRMNAAVVQNFQQQGNGWDGGRQQFGPPPQW